MLREKIFPDKTNKELFVHWFKNGNFVWELSDFLAGIYADTSGKFCDCQSYTGTGEIAPGCTGIHVTDFDDMAGEIAQELLGEGVI